MVSCFLVSHNSPTLICLLVSEMAVMVFGSAYNNTQSQCYLASLDAQKQRNIHNNKNVLKSTALYGDGQ